MKYDAQQQKVPAPGTYRVFNALSYTQQELHVDASGADMYAAATGIYPATFLRRVTLDDVAAVLDCPLTKVYSFTPAPVPVPTIGKPAARELHRELGRAGIPAKEHYGYASAALDLPVYSLALLTPDQLDAVLTFLDFTHGAHGEAAA
ncbi:hypothetical protein [Deinococcus gobiensis]|uniref:Uncharacterized protein n=1 Tax=Deinococcus gobiensis (strain DSM 21396 / JCM 16679 / CGMCC 1.7299 / I-0) TaxID=745776 RepID=H8GXQ8_DEIGI|nr:hypothetical protein [Deinococcus gobiensis]AFD25910.1 hypothetical protein DGo_CA1983 [Deinococcus gobiensis I-0]